MKKITGEAKNLKQLLLNTKYSIHYYQREYRWKQEHMEALIEDLTTEFLTYYKPGDDAQKARDYGAYFMGSIVLTGKENAIIDGQQRLSSLTLLLIYLRNRLKPLKKEIATLNGMIYSEAYGKDSFNLNVAEREKCMKALYGKREDSGESESEELTDFEGGESVRNLCARYEDIESLFPGDITDDMIPIFFYWLADNVYFIEIAVEAEQDAYKVFVTMNDRGLRLTSTEMLKGYLLSEIKSDKNRVELETIWKSRVSSLIESDDKGDETFLKTWLRAQYAETIREPKAGAVNQDFDIIGGPFHKWVRDEHAKLGLNDAADFEDFIRRFDFFAGVYEQILQAETEFQSETPYVYYNARVNFTLQPQLLLAPVRYQDKPEDVTTKLNLTARFIDLLIIARVTNYHYVDYNTIKNYVFGVTKDIRRADISTLKKKLAAWYQKLAFNPKEAVYQWGVNNFTKKYVKHFLARVTEFLETESGEPSHYVEYMDTDTKNPFEIEHILCDNYNRFKGQYEGPEDFKAWRNGVGALLLLPKKINASLKDKPYKDKLKKYVSAQGNLYSESLGEAAYQNNPGFQAFIKRNKLKKLFRPYAQFGKAEIEERTQLLIRLTNLIWNGDMFQ